jgi:hypothetical protein
MIFAKKKIFTTTAHISTENKTLKFRLVIETHQNVEEYRHIEEYTNKTHFLSFDLVDTRVGYINELMCNKTNVVCVDLIHMTVLSLKETFTGYLSQGFDEYGSLENRSVWELRLSPVPTYCSL